jgi:hypothetical protein
MEKSFESQRELHQLLDEGLESVTANNGKSGDFVFSDIEKRFDNISAQISKKVTKSNFSNN